MYSMFNVIETLFYLSLAITFFLMILLVYHFKQRITFLEQKNETMFEIINTIVKELNNIKNSFIEFERAKENMNDSTDDEMIEKVIPKVERRTDDVDEEVDTEMNNKMNSRNYNVKIIHLNDLMNEKINIGSFFNEGIVEAFSEGDEPIFRKEMEENINFPVSFMNSFQPEEKDGGNVESPEFSEMKLNKIEDDDNIHVMDFTEESKNEEIDDETIFLNEKINVNVSKIENIDIDVECITFDDSELESESESEHEDEAEPEPEPQTNKNIIDCDDDTEEEFNEKNTNMIDLEKKYKKMNITQLRKIIKENTVFEEDSIKIDKMKKNDLIKLLLNNI